MNNLNEEFVNYVKINDIEAKSAFLELNKIVTKDKLFYFYEQTPFLYKPVFINKELIKKMHSEINEIINIITRVPAEVFNKNAQEYCKVLGFNEEETKLLEDTLVNEYKILLSRTDVINNYSYKFIEFNINSSLGGMEIASLNKKMLTIDFYRRFLDLRNISFLDPYEKVVDLFLESTEEDVIPTVAIVDWYPDMMEYMSAHEDTKEFFKKRNLNVVICNQYEVINRGGYLYHKDRKIDIVYRMFLLTDVKKEEFHILRDILEPVTKGHAIMINDMSSELFTNKGNMAILSDPLFRSKINLNDSDIEIIDKRIPWTRFLIDEETTDENGEKINLCSYIIQNKNSMILKPTNGYGGDKVFPGWNYETEEWENIIHSNLVGEITYIVQKRVLSNYVRTPIIINGNVKEIEVAENWGVFSFNGNLAGVMIRALEKSKGDIINVSKGAQTGCAFFT